MLIIKYSEFLIESSVKKSEKIDIFRDNDYIVVSPLCERAAVKYGAFSDWCTSVPHSGAWQNVDLKDMFMVIIIQRNYPSITKEEKVRMDKFMYYHDRIAGGITNDRLDKDEIKDFRSMNPYENMNLEKICIVFSKRKEEIEIWDMNNLKIDDWYESFMHLPIRRDVLNEIADFFDSCRNTKEY